MNSRKYFNLIIDSISEKSPLQKKKIRNILEKKGDCFFLKAEQFAEDYIGYLKYNNISLDYAINAYLSLCQDMIKSQIKFIKTGKYTINSSSAADQSVYQNEKEMKAYMIGLAISQFIWPSHFDMFSFFSNSIKNSGSEVKNYLEIGPGHGLFLKEAIKWLNRDCMITAIDISPYSIEITKSIMAFFKSNSGNTKYITGDILHYANAEPFDFITMGEVLEHVECPDVLLGKLYSLLASSGASFISTCVNCPAKDHVYHFKKVDDIIALVEMCKFRVIDELVCPVEKLPMEEIIKNKVTINYCALIEKAI
jgi:ubiquinone/menaquinone biosynthesis C-methylase UbiE